MIFRHGSNAEEQCGPYGEAGWFGAALAVPAVVLLGVLVGVLAIVSLGMWNEARNARADAAQVSVSSTAGMDMSTSAPGGLTSYAGAAPRTPTSSRQPTRRIRRRFPRRLPAVADVNLKLTDIEIEIAPGIHYSAWAWAGGAPAP